MGPRRQGNRRGKGGGSRLCWSNVIYVFLTCEVGLLTAQSRDSPFGNRRADRGPPLDAKR